LADLFRAEPALGRHVLQDGLAGGGLGQAPDGIGVVPAETRLSPAMATAQAEVPDGTRLRSRINGVQWERNTASAFRNGYRLWGRTTANEAIVRTL
jgi:hypothetical protein